MIDLSRWLCLAFGFALAAEGMLQQPAAPRLSPLAIVSARSGGRTMIIVFFLSLGFRSIAGWPVRWWFMGHV